MPGVIGDIGTILGNNKINIAGMQFGRKEAGGIAIAIVNVDSFIPDNILEELKNAPNIKSIKLVKL